MMEKRNLCWLVLWQNDHVTSSCMYTETERNYGQHLCERTSVGGQLKRQSRFRGVKYGARPADASVAGILLEEIQEMKHHRTERERIYSPHHTSQAHRAQSSEPLE